MPKKCMYKKKGSEDLFYKVDELQKDGNFREVERKFNIKDFEIGFTCNGKLAYKHVKGGVILVPTEFTIKKNISLFKN